MIFDFTRYERWVVICLCRSIQRLLPDWFSGLVGQVHQLMELAISLRIFTIAVFETYFGLSSGRISSMFNIGNSHDMLCHGRGNCRGMRKVWISSGRRQFVPPWASPPLFIPLIPDALQRRAIRNNPIAAPFSEWYGSISKSTFIESQHSFLFLRADSLSVLGRLLPVFYTFLRNRERPA